MAPAPQSPPSAPASTPSADPGIGVKFGATTRRAINHDGTFNVRRRSRQVQVHNLYQDLISMSWAQFLGVIFALLLGLNILFAAGYLLLGLEHLSGTAALTHIPRFWQAFFFSVQTFTTVGYGGLAPNSIGTGLLASLEAITGLLTAALATGLLYGRFSRPRASILFSRTALVSRRPDGTPNLQFRVANMQRSTLVELHVRVLLQLNSPEGNRLYYPLTLERDTINFFPLNWTIVHDITPDSPLHELTLTELADRQAEILILIRGYDDTFAQDVHARNSYRFDELEWNRRFVRTYEVADNGMVVLDLDKLHESEPLAGNEE